MKQKRLTIIGVACGIVCALCVVVFMQGVRGQANAARDEALARYGGEQVEVCVATRDIAAGERVDAGAVEAKLWIADLLPDEPYLSAGDVVGKTAVSSIMRGEVLSAKRFEREHSTLEVPQGMAAVSVPAKTVQAVGGAIEPGMHVDVYIAADTSTAIIAQDVAVLATSVGAEGGSLVADSSWITLAVAPERVQEIVAASSRYDLYFVLPGEAPAVDASEQTAEPADAGTEAAAYEETPAVETPAEGGIDPMAAGGEQMPAEGEGEGVAYEENGGDAGAADGAGADPNAAAEWAGTPEGGY